MKRVILFDTESATVADIDEMRAELDRRRNELVCVSQKDDSYADFISCAAKYYNQYKNGHERKEALTMALNSAFEYNSRWWRTATDKRCVMADCSGTYDSYRTSIFNDQFTLCTDCWNSTDDNNVEECFVPSALKRVRRDVRKASNKKYKEVL